MQFDLLFFFPCVFANLNVMCFTKNAASLTTSLTILKQIRAAHHSIIASLDVKKLFTNVPVFQTIDIILNSVYTNNSIPPSAIKPFILKKLLHAITTKVPFYDHNGNIYTQSNDVSMGNPLGSCFSNYYMSHVENDI